ncbi:MAG TPA: glycolate oxidase subunit GlcF [Alphaproteobacteria bacterium]|nr:glycolate oxidase subunit GlcF [Alphaproteobacteria bacterium]
MQTNFTLAQLADPAVAESEKILRTCVHCGFCLATCPTYVTLGDELDSPRGRIYQIKDMLENDRPAPDPVVRHIDRCLSCLSCMTTCPSGVHYMHLVDHARAHIERTHRRDPWDRLLRGLLARLLPYPRRFRLALMAAGVGRPVARLLPAGTLKERFQAMLDLAPRRLPAASPVDRPATIPAEGPRRARVALLNGCAQTVLDPAINEATVRLLTRHGVEVVVAKGAGCCGSLTHHLGKAELAHASAKANIAAWCREAEGGGLDAIVINTSGCGTTVKDYGFMFRDDPDWAKRAASVSALAKDVTEFMADIGLDPPAAKAGLRVAYHSACSMQHGQRVQDQPKALISKAGFDVVEVPEGHLCCGSAGTYNLLQPELARELRTRKVANIERTTPDLVATGNIGCMTQIGAGTTIPIVHTVELLDWATGGPPPAALEGLAARKSAAE